MSLTPAVYDAEFVVHSASAPLPVNPPVAYVRTQLGEMDDVTKYSLLAGGLILVIAGVAMWRVSKSAGLGEAPSKYERCVRSVKRQRRRVNPWAVCTAALQRSGHFKKGTRKRR